MNSGRLLFPPKKLSNEGQANRTSLGYLPHIFAMGKQKIMNCCKETSTETQHVRCAQFYYYSAGWVTRAAGIVLRRARLSHHMLNPVIPNNRGRNPESSTRVRQTSPRPCP